MCSVPEQFEETELHGAAGFDLGPDPLVLKPGHGWLGKCTGRLTDEHVKGRYAKGSCLLANSHGYSVTCMPSSPKHRLMQGTE